MSLFPRRVVRFAPLAVCLAVAPAAAQEDPLPGVAPEPGLEADEPAPPEITGDDWTQWEGITGDWGGLRSDLAESGIGIGAEYIAEYSGVIDGGVRERWSFRNLFTLDLTLDTEAAFDLPGGTFFVQYLSVNPEDGGSRDAGDIQVYSNIESDRHLDTIYELWYEQLFFDDRLRLKVGKLDANSEFAYVDVAGDFAHSSAGFSPSVFVFPSYPESAMSVNIFGRVLDTDAAALTLGYGFYDGAAGVDGVHTGSRGPSSFFDDETSDDYFHIGQAELTWDDLGGRSDGWLQGGRLSVGGWLHTGEFDRFDGGSESDAAGFFLTVEQRLLAREGDEEGGLYVLGQYGRADDEVSEIGGHYALGLVSRGTFAGREADSAGVYLSFADLSDEAGAGFEEDEFAIDCYYRWQATPAIFVQPEVQYIIDPSGDPAIDDALVGGLRIGIAF
jgi:porin